MRILELFSGTGEVSKAFRDRGHQTFEIDWNEKFNSDLHMDLCKLTTELVLEEFGIPDVMWIAFDCTTFSLAAISHHRVKNNETGNLDPISDYAKKCDAVDQNVLKVMEELRKLNPKMLFFIENPRACLQKMTWMQPYDKYKHTITYCKYLTDRPFEERRMKPTNIWTNHPDPKFLPPCGYGDDCHIKAPRGSRTGTQGMKGAKERSTYPKLLINHIVDICEEYGKEVGIMKDHWDCEYYEVFEYFNGDEETKYIELLGYFYGGTDGGFDSNSKWNETYSARDVHYGVCFPLKEFIDRFVLGNEDFCDSDEYARRKEYSDDITNDEAIKRMRMEKATPLQIGTLTLDVPCGYYVDACE